MDKGWGLSSATKTIFPQIMQEAALPVIALDDCKSAFTDNRFAVTDRNVCTKLKGTDACGVG